MAYSRSIPVLIGLLLLATDAGALQVCGMKSEGNTVYISSPHGGIITSIDFADYGLPIGSCGSFSSSGCSTPTAKSIVESLCLGRLGCSVPAENSLFGDPCGGQFKHLCIQATTSDAGAVDAICELVPEDENAVLVAPPGFIISAIEFVSYGAPMGDCATFALTGCHAASSRAIIEAACLGKSECQVRASNTIFGDPCPNTIKRLAIRATVVPIPTTTRPTTWGRLKAWYR